MASTSKSWSGHAGIFGILEATCDSQEKLRKDFESYLQWPGHRMLLRSFSASEPYARCIGVRCLREVCTINR